MAITYGPIVYKVLNRPVVEVTNTGTETFTLYDGQDATGRSLHVMTANSTFTVSCRSGYLYAAFESGEGTFTGTGDVSTGANPAVVTGDGTWSVAVAISYTITTSVTNGTYSGATSIVQGGTATVTIAPNSTYTLPSTITVSGATYTYDSTSGVVSLSNPTGNVTITAVCEAVVTGYSGNITIEVEGGASAFETYIKFGSAPDSGSDYDAYVNNNGVLTGATTYTEQTKAYIWSGISYRGCVEINGTTTDCNNTTYSNAVEVTLTGNYDIKLLYNVDDSGA